MQYYKFPDYLYPDATKFINQATQYYDIDCCEKGSNTIITALRLPGANGNLEVSLQKLISSNGELQVSTYATWSNNTYDLIEKRKQKESLKIIKYDNNKPSAVALLAKKRTSPQENVILFFAINIVDITSADISSTDSYIRQIDFEFIEPNLTPSDISVDLEQNLLYISYRNKIVILDIADLTNINKITEYTINDTDRLNDIKDFTVDYVNNLIVCLTNNQYRYFDKINILYYDPVNRVITLRGSYTAAANDHVNYNSVQIYGNYIYTNNINSLDINGIDSNRSKVGLYIFKTTDNFQTLINVKSIPFGYYWNDKDMPIDKADIGYKPRDQMMHYGIAKIKNQIMYVMTVALNNYTNSNTGLPDYSINNISSMLMYNISNPENFVVIGSNAIQFANSATSPYNNGILPSFEDYKVYVIEENTIDGEKIIVENGVNSRSSYGISKIHLINTENISLFQEISFDTGIPYDIDYYSEPGAQHGILMAVANGTYGVQIRYYNTQTNQYDLLSQLRPINPATQSYDDIRKVIIYGTSIDKVGFFLFGHKNIYVYNFNNQSFAINPGAIYNMSLFGINDDIIKDIHATFVTNKLYFFVKTELSN